MLLFPLVFKQASVRGGSEDNGTILLTTLINNNNSGEGKERENFLFPLYCSPAHSARPETTEGGVKP